MSEVLEDCELELFSNLIEGKTKSEEVFYNHFYGFVFSIVFKYVLDRGDAEELTNDCFIKIFNSKRKYKNEKGGTLKAWIGRIAINTAVDHFRKSNKKRITDSLESKHEVISDGQVEAISRLQAEDVFEMLKELPDDQRMVYILYEMEGYNHNEVGELCKIRSSHSRMLLTRAKRNLRAIYSEKFCQ